MEVVFLTILDKLDIILITLLAMVLNLTMTISRNRKNVPPLVMDIIEYSVVTLSSVAVALIFFWGVTLITSTIEIRMAGLLFGGILGNRVLQLFSDAFLQEIADKAVETIANNDGGDRTRRKRRYNERAADTPPDDFWQEADEYDYDD